jgi:hypothetical protein
LTEIKCRVRGKDVEQVQKSIDAFRELFPKYAHYTLYAGIAGLSFEEDAIAKAHEQGLFVLKQVGDLVEVDAVAMKAF